MKKPQCNATIRIIGIPGLFCCTLKKDHEVGNKVSHIFEVTWGDYDDRDKSKTDLGYPVCCRKCATKGEPIKCNEDRSFLDGCSLWNEK